MLARVTKLECEVVIGKDSVADLRSNSEKAEKWGDDVAYEKNGLQACFQHARRELDKVIDGITSELGGIDCFNAGLKEGCEYLKCRADEEGRQALSQFEIWVTELVAEGQQKHFQDLKTTNN